MGRAPESFWKTIEDWIGWQSSEKRDRNEVKIEPLLETSTRYEIYDIRTQGEGPVPPSAAARAAEAR